MVQAHGTVTLPEPNLSHWDRESSKSDLSQFHRVPSNLKTPLSQSHPVPPNLKTLMSQSHLSQPIRRPSCPSVTCPNLSHKVGLQGRATFMCPMRMNLSTKLCMVLPLPPSKANTSNKAWGDAVCWLRMSREWEPPSPVMQASP